MPAIRGRSHRNVTKGSYILLIELGRDRSVRVGVLGDIGFPKGRYVYVGSAMSGIESRVARHARRRKKEHWHIDRLIRAGRVVGAWMIPAKSDIECEVNDFVERLEGASSIVRGFGSSDCSCASHLHLVDERAIASISSRFGPLTPARVLRAFGR